MARFDVYKNKRGNPPLLCQIQATYHDHFDSRVVIPMQPFRQAAKEFKAALTPRVMIDEGEYLLMTADMATVSVKHLGKKVGSLEKYHYDITSAVDFLFQGF